MTAIQYYLGGTRHNIEDVEDYRVRVSGVLVVKKRSRAGHPKQKTLSPGVEWVVREDL